MTKSDQAETYTEAETITRREAALKRAFAMPHKPHKQKDSDAPDKRAPRRNTVKSD